jgi:putative ABC transport system ATP-binding protein
MSPAAADARQLEVVPDVAPPIVELIKVEKKYMRGKEQLLVLQALDLSIQDGAFAALMGPSGSGKSTLLNLIAGLDRPSSGTIRVAGVEVGALSESQCAKWRAANIGFIFQTYNMLPVLTALENVELPLLLARLSSKERRERARTALSVVGLENRMQHYPRELSGGQEQRVAIARAIVTDPRLIVADEPTGDLDRKSADDILSLLRRLNSELRKTIVMVTHDPAAAESATKVHQLDKGALI